MDQITARAPLSQPTLESLVIAIMHLKTTDGKLTNLQPRDVLQDWILEQIPSEMHDSEYWR